MLSENINGTRAEGADGSESCLRVRLAQSLQLIEVGPESAERHSAHPTWKPDRRVCEGGAVTDDEAVAVLRALALARDADRWLVTRMLTELQLSLSDRDWFRLAAERFPGLEIWESAVCDQEEDEGR
jgi:hypothetical protein